MLAQGYTYELQPALRALQVAHKGEPSGAQEGEGQRSQQERIWWDAQGWRLIQIFQKLNSIQLF